MSIARSHSREIARSTMAILEAGEYRTESGTLVSISDRLQQAISGTESCPPDVDIPTIRPGVEPTRITVDNMTTLAAVAMVAAEGYSPAALNFASAKNPGGGFLKGARAQEESLARASGLYPCIASNPMYDYHRSRHDCMCSHYAIYSPGVPVIREDDGRLLEQPVCCAFITAPAVNAGVVLHAIPHGVHVNVDASGLVAEEVLVSDDPFPLLWTKATMADSSASDNSGRAPTTAARSTPATTRSVLSILVAVEVSRSPG